MPLPFRLGAFYCAHFIHVGLFMAYFPLYLAGRGFGAVEIAWVLALPSIMRMFAPAGWGVVADRTGALRALVAFSCAALALGFAALPAELPRVVSIGRLDYNTEGLLLLTNDGALARHMELPATGWTRRYRVRAKGRVTPADLEKIKDGVEIDGVRYGPIDAAIDSVQGANMWLTIGIREGKNREVRKILTHLGVEVNRLIRVSFGPFQLLDLAPGGVEQVKRRTLAEQIGPQLAQELGLAQRRAFELEVGRGVFEQHFPSQEILRFIHVVADALQGFASIGNGQEIIEIGILVG